MHLEAAGEGIAAALLPIRQRWAAQEEALFAADGTRNRADLIVDISR